jgi:predicted metal-dependent hydrolase
MAVKNVEVEGIGDVAFYKRRGASHVRLSVASNGTVRVTLPIWAPYKVGIDFVKSRADWIREQVKPPKLLVEGQAVGGAHQLHFVTTTGRTVTSRVAGGRILIGLPKTMAPDDPKAQSTAEQASIRALRKEAEQVLPIRLKQLAEEHGFTYQSVQIKRLKGRWGSCSQQKEIVFNCFLMQLPPKLIDYVIIHELVHTRIMAHGPVFWEEVGKYVTNLPMVRKVMRTHQPVING